MRSTVREAEAPLLSSSRRHGVVPEVKRHKEPHKATAANADELPPPIYPAKPVGSGVNVDKVRQPRRRINLAENVLVAETARREGSAQAQEAEHRVARMAPEASAADHPRTARGRPIPAFNL